jgi:hypothetical protein
VLEFLNFLVLLFKVIVFCLIVAFFFWVAPAIIMEVLEEQREKHPKKQHPHRRRRNDKSDYMQKLVQSYRENKALARALTFEYAKPTWSM